MTIWLYIAVALGIAEVVTVVLLSYAIAAARDWQDWAKEWERRAMLYKEQRNHMGRELAQATRAREGRAP